MHKKKRYVSLIARAVINLFYEIWTLKRGWALNRGNTVGQSPINTF